MALTKGIMECQGNHYYKFDNKIFQQSKGGSIGTEITGELSKIYMNSWDKKLLDKLQGLGITVLMMKRYVDDILIMLAEL